MLVDEQKQEDVFLPGNKSISRFLTDVGAFGIANLVALLSGIVQTFIIPKYLSVEGYGYWRLFMLYAGYMGFLHFGFIDGVFISWLGRNPSEFKGELKLALKYLIVQQVIVVGIFLVGLIFAQSFFHNSNLFFILFVVFIMAFITNVFALFSFALQANKQFKFLSLLTIFQQFGLLGGILFLFGLGMLQYQLLVIWQVINTGLVLAAAVCFLRSWFREPVPSQLPGLWNYGWQNINIGWYVLLGNFITVLFFSIDRLFTSSLFSIQEFAYYSLAASFLGVIYLFINTLGRVVLPYLAGISREGAQKIYPVGCNLIVFIWGLGLGLYFPLSAFIAWYLPHYLSSLPVLKVLICSAGFGGVINIMHSNYYKTNKLVRPYFAAAAIALVLFIGLAAGGLYFWHTPLTIAVATVISFGSWYLLNERQLIRFSGQTKQNMIWELLVIVGLIGAFLSSSLLPIIWQQMLLYYGLFLAFYFLFFRVELRPVFALLGRVVRMSEMSN